ncbi:MAG TPA: DUF488 family protein [Pyrinomonadaceae bacterium]|nr:DUF488 family protein [Pyrinomonadaceae bacterium]
MINRIFATGYSEKDINDLKPLVERLNAILVDIRFVPYSEIMFWRRVYLKTLLGNKYLHIVNLGNRSFKERDKISIQNLNLGLETLLSLNTNVILFCACAEAENCHRRVIAEELKKSGIMVTEIEDWKNALIS